jgi:hypothetical protein
MTIVTFTSLKGAPGVTTLSRLVGATWPEGRKVMLLECDASGGDLAARFQLSARDGWVSFNAAVRRGGATAAIEPHLQELPGGLPVLVGAKGNEVAEQTESIVALLSAIAGSPGEPWDVLVDLGRLVPREPGSVAWIERSEHVVICTRGDAASALHVREKAPAIRDRCPGRVGLELMWKGPYSRSDLEGFTGIPVFGVCPFDEMSASMATGERRTGRRLARSPLVAGARRLASLLACGTNVAPEGSSRGIREYSMFGENREGGRR